MRLLISMLLVCVSATLAQAKVNPAQHIAVDLHAVGGPCYSFDQPRGLARHRQVKRHRHERRQRVVVRHEKKTASKSAPKPVLLASVDPTESIKPEIVEPVVTKPARVLARAIAYIGTNPTGWARDWCGKFMGILLPELAAKIDNPNWARDWAAAGPRTNSPKPGDIVVLARGRQHGHVGLLEKFDRHGNPVIISGNHGHRVGRGTYARSRVLAYVSLL